MLEAGTVRELFNDCVGLAMSLGLIIIVACCMAPIAKILGVTGRKRKSIMRKQSDGQGIGPLEAVCLTLIAVLLVIEIANGTVSGIISSLLGK